MRNSLFLITTTLAITMIGAPLDGASAQEHPNHALSFTVGPRFIYVPENYILLVRKGTQIGAIQLKAIRVDKDGNGQADYFSYFQPDGSGSLAKSNIIRRKGQIDIRPMVGIGHSLTWQPGKNKLWVGRWWFGCYSPHLVNMAEHFSESDEGFEFAPTSAIDISEVAPSTPKLRWFRYLRDDSIELPISDLPK